MNILNIVKAKREKEQRLKEAQLTMTKRYICQVSSKS